MIHRTAHASIFPACMFQASQLSQLLTNPIRRPAILRQRQISSNIRSTLYKFRLEVLNSCRDLLIDLASDAGGAQEDRVTEEANSDVSVADASEKAVATKRIEGLARVAENEEYKYDVADAVVVPVSDDDRRFAGEARSTYRSRLRADKCALDARPYPSSLFCRATGRVVEPIVSL